MIELGFNPALVMVLGAILVWLLPGRLYKLVALLLPLVVLVMIWLASDKTDPVELMSYAVVPFTLTSLAKLFASVFAAIAFAGVWYASNHSSRAELSAATLYAGSAIGVSLAGDFITLFIYWELMAIASTVVILAAHTPQANRAALRYAIIHIFGGTCLLYGIVGIVTLTGDATLRQLVLDNHFAWAILIGFVINVGAPPLSAWIADAYPEASPAGAVFLSAFTTKAAVFALLSVFAGADILIWLGMYMIFYGIVYALLENDMRRILAYSIVNQVGFMVVACGIGTPLAVNAAAAHAAAHIIYKGLLMMSAGSVLFMTGKRKCTDLGGLYREMRLTMVCAVAGAASISAVPLTSGFSAKSLINTSALQADMQLVWFALLVGAAGVFLHAGIKFPWFVFFSKKPIHRNLGKVPFNMHAAMLLLVSICILLGVVPQALYALLPYPIDYEPYTWIHTAEQMQLLTFSAIAFFVLLPWLARTTTISLDFDWFYRKFPVCIERACAPGLAHLWHKLAGLYISPYQLVDLLQRRLSIAAFSAPPLSAWLTIVFAIMLAVVLLVYYAVL